MKTTPDVHQILRLVSLLRSESGAYVDYIAAKLGVGTRKLLHLVQTATLCGKHPFGPGDLVDIWIDDENRMHLLLDQDLGRPLRFTLQEALAISVALHGLIQSGAGGYAETAKSSLSKLKDKMSKDIAGPVAEVERRIAVEGAGSGLEMRYALLHEGHRSRRAVEIEYYTASRDEITTRRVRVYLLMQHLGFWYIVGHDSNRNDELIFKLERVKSVKLTDTTYEIPASFESEKYQRNELFIGVKRVGRVRFRPPLSEHVKAEWEPSRFEPQPDGSVIGRFEYTHPEGAANTILSMGPGAEIIEPKEVEEAYLRRCQEALALHDA